MDPELTAMSKLVEALEDLDEVIRLRVLKWAADRYNVKITLDSSRQLEQPSQRLLLPPLIPSGYECASGEGEKKEIRGIAIVNSNGKFDLTVRDFKAKNTNDAAIRIAHVAILAYCKLTGEAEVSSRRIIVPILRKYRAYTGNTRYILSRQPGIIRNGDLLSLDAHSQVDAEKYVEDILDPTIEGQWNPSSRAGKKRPKKTAASQLIEQDE